MVMTMMMMMMMMMMKMMMMMMLMMMMMMMMMINKQDTCNHRYYIIPLKGKVLDYLGTEHVNLIP